MSIRRYTLEESASRLRNRLEEIKSVLPATNDPSLLNIPRQVDVQSGALVHRSYTLAEAAFDDYCNGNLLTAFILTRATFESVSMMFLLGKKISNALQSENTDELRKSLDRMIQGSRNSDSEVSAYNVLTLIDEISKEIAPCRSFYDDLSEYTHPNFAGTTAAFGKLNEEKSLMLFGLDLEPFKEIGHLPIEASIILIQPVYERLVALQTPLRELCDEEC